MATSNNSSSRVKFVNLVKQLTGIEYSIEASSEHIDELKILSRLPNEEVVLLANEEASALSRAKSREEMVLARQQYNLEQIFGLALGHVRDDAFIDRLDLDWVMQFIDLAKQSYSATMHELWSKIFAIELTQQGTFSRRSLKTLAELSAREAKLFYKAVKAMVNFGEERAGRIISGAYKKPTLINLFGTQSKLNIKLSNYGLSYTQIINLAELGLLYQQEIETPLLSSLETIKLNHHRQTGQLSILQKDVVVTYYKFTQVGYELSKLIKPNIEDDFLEIALSEISSLVGYTSGLQTTS